jgi:putative FmdB family regulatory protein
MPIYEYECESCHHAFEVWQKITEEPVKKCEACGSTRVTKLISQSTFHLKGTGWYLTDYARKGGSSGGKPGQKSSPGKSEPTSSTERSSSGSSSSASDGSKT